MIKCKYCQEKFRRIDKQKILNEHTFKEMLLEEIKMLSKIKDTKRKKHPSNVKYHD